MRFALAISMLSLAACGDVARLEVDLRFPSADLQQTVQQLLVVVREPAPAGDPCEPLWGAPPANLGQYARLVDYPNSSDIVAAPLKTGRYTVFVYALGERFDTLCESDADCVVSGVGPSCRPLPGGQRACTPSVGPSNTLAGGCGQNAVSETETNQLFIQLDPPPGS